MCCFSRPVKHVSATHIFARLQGDRQFLVYSMNLEIDDELAMVLPLPIAPGSPEDSVQFVDLSGYPGFFTDLRKAFPEVLSFPKRGGLLRAAPIARPKLEVHEVGAFVASFVPSPNDWDRLDERFRLPKAVFDARKEYADYGFAVFQLAPKKGWFGRLKRQTIHPMAFSFPTRRPRALFYPTLHVHDGSIPEKAGFDHSLYFQSTDEVLLRTGGFERTEKNAGASVDTEKMKGIVDAEAKCYRQVIMFEQRNEDVWYDPPACAGAHVLEGKGTLFTFQLCATAAYYSHVEHEPQKQWHRSARTKLDAVHAALNDGLARLTKENETTWGLVPVAAEDLERVWLSNDDVYGSGEHGPLRLETNQARRVRLQMSTRMDEMEPQQFVLGFERVPAPETVAAIRKAVNEIVRTAVQT